MDSEVQKINLRLLKNVLCLKLDQDMNERKFKAMFGISRDATTFVMYLLGITEPTCVFRLLMTLNFFKVYSTESVASVLFKVSEKTYREWVRHYVLLIADLNLVM